MSTAEQIIAEVIARAMVNALGADGGVYVRDDDGLDDVLLDGRADMLEVSAHVVAALTNAGTSEWFVKRDGITWIESFPSREAAERWASKHMDGGRRSRIVHRITIESEVESWAAARVAEGGER